jgi:general secretion pathway protein D
MSRPSTLILPLLLTLPFAAMSQEDGAIPPALRAKLLAQVPPPAAPPATAGAPPVPKPTTVPLPTSATPAATGTPAPPVTPAQAPGTGQRPGQGNRGPRAAVPGPGNNPGQGNTGRNGRNQRTPVPSPLQPAAAQNTNNNNAVPSAAAAPGLPPDPNNKYGDIAFVNADINDVIGKYEEISRRHVIRDKDLAGNVTVYANPYPEKPFSPAEAAEFIKAALAIQGFVIQKYNESTDKVLMLNRNPSIDSSINGFPLYTKEEDLPDEDQVVNFVLVLNYLPVVEGSQVLSAAVPVHQWAKYVAVPSANSIFIQEYVSNIRTLLKVAKTLDLKPIDLVHIWVDLERASAEDVQAILDQILQAQTKSNTAGSTGFRSISPNAGAANLGQPGQAATGGASASSGVMADGSSVIVKADPRTNRVFINGPAKHVAYLKALIREFDEPSRVKNLLTQQLRYIPVNEFFNLALTALETSGAGQAGSAGGAGGGGGGRNAGGGGGGGRNFGANDFGGGGGGRNSAGTNQFGNTRNTGSSFGTGGQGGGGAGRNGTSSGLNGGTSNTNSLEPPQAQTVGKTLLISDPRTNSLIVSGPPDSIQRVSDLVKEMDRRPYQVHINAVIAQMAIGNDMQTAVDYLRKVDKVTIGGETIDAAGLFRSGANASFIDPSTLINSAAFPTTTTGLQIFAAVNDLFNAYVKTLENTTNSKLLAKPHITVANNETGTISSGSRIPIPANQQSTVVAGGTTSLNSSVEYENVVLELQVTPLINSKNEITLTVDQLNDSIEGTTNISGNDIPNIATQTLHTKITVPNGAILVLGGLISENEVKGTSGIPILNRIPVIKYLFGSTSHQKQRRELVVLLQASIIETADDMVDVNNSEIQRTVVGPNAVRFASPNRNTDNVKLPTFESDIPFDNAGSAPAVQSTTPPPASTGKKAVRAKGR